MKRPTAVTELIEELKRLPGVGQKTAERLSFFLMRSKVDQATKLANAIHNIKDKIILCSVCHGITETDPCGICSNSSRDQKQICVVEEPHDVYVMENMGYYKGVYHVLMGVISPLDGIGPDDLNIERLIHRASRSETQEIILALSATVDGQTTAHYIGEKLTRQPVYISRLAHGMPVGGELDYLDDGTLAQALKARAKLEI